MSGILTPHRFGLFNSLELYAIDPAGNLKDFTGDVEMSLPVQHYDVWKQICMPTVVQLDNGLATLPMGIGLPDNNTLPNRLIPTEIIAMSLVSTNPITGSEPIVLFPNENTGNVVGVHQFDQMENHSTRNNQCLSTSGDSFFDVFFSLNTDWDGRDVSLSQDNRKFVLEFDENTLPFVIPSPEGFQFSIQNSRHSSGWAHQGIELGNYRSDDGRWIEGNVLIREIGLGPQHFLGSFKLCFYANGSKYY